jgi:hypothetical protein
LEVPIQQPVPWAARGKMHGWWYIEGEATIKERSIFEFFFDGNSPLF